MALMYRYVDIPRGSNVVPFWLWPVFFLGIVIYVAKKGTTFAPLGIYIYIHSFYASGRT